VAGERPAGRWLQPGAALSHKTKLGREVDLPKQLRRLAAAPATSGPVGSQSAGTIPSRTALGTHKVGKGPFGVAAQGEFVFASNFFGKSLTKLRASDGSILGTFKIGDGAAGVAADENGLWEFFVFDCCETFWGIDGCELDFAFCRGRYSVAAPRLLCEF